MLQQWIHIVFDRHHLNQQLYDHKQFFKHVCLQT